jgi:hypothetical protein
MQNMSTPQKNTLQGDHSKIVGTLEHLPFFSSLSIYINIYLYY